MTHKVKSNNMVQNLGMGIFMFILFYFIWFQMNTACIPDIFLAFPYILGFYFILFY